VKDSWKQALVSPQATIRQAIRAIDESKVQIALVVDEAGHLLGTVTDGDVRRGLLRGLGTEEPVGTVMNRKPVTVRHDETPSKILELMKETTHRSIPSVDPEGRAAGVHHLGDFLQARTRENPVVLMAGGLGTRLNPITHEVPKPLIRVGTKPILETILDNFREYGFRDFYISVNYKAEMVKDYFQDGARWGVSIRYLEEDMRLGTAGSLSLLPERPRQPLIVMNGDLLTKVNFEQMLDFHLQHRAAATMAVREYDLQVPFGVVTLGNDEIVGIDEKPVHRFFVNAGIYVLEPDTLDLVPRATPFDMTTLFQHLMQKGRSTGAFPIREYWLDVGRLDDLERARLEFATPEA
jgi:dTDP-glucose pyrophosphorylase/predicted transcriptional regulator